MFKLSPPTVSGFNSFMEIISANKPTERKRVVVVKGMINLENESPRLRNYKEIVCDQINYIRLIISESAAEKYCFEPGKAYSITYVKCDSSNFYNIIDAVTFDPKTQDDEEETESLGSESDSDTLSIDYTEDCCTNFGEYYGYIP